MTDNAAGDKVPSVGATIDGPISVYVPPSDFEAKGPDYPNTSVDQAISSELPGAEMFGGMVTIDDEIPLHYHSWFEMQYVVSGEGLALDSLGREIPIAPGGFVFSPAGRAGAHGFRRVGDEPLKIMFMYPTPGGHAPDRFEFHPEGTAL